MKKLFRFSTAAHKPYLLVLSDYQNYYYTRSQIRDSIHTGQLLWASDPEKPHVVEPITIEQALKCLDVYADWWNGTSKLEEA